MTTALQAVLQLKQQKEARQLQQQQTTISLLNQFAQQGQQRQAQELAGNISLAKSGLKFGEGGGIVRDQSLEDPLSALVKRAQTSKAIFEAGGPDIGIGSVGGGSASPGLIKGEDGNFSFNGEPVQVDSFDRFGRPTGFKPKKPSAAQEKRDVEIKELEGQVGNLITSFKEARQEADSIPGIGDLGLGGRAAGKLAVGKGKLGFSPKVNVFQDRIKAFATTVAKAAGEVRPTDQDIERFIGTLPTLEKNDAENEEIIKGLMNDLQARGAKTLWTERTSELPKGIPQELGVNFLSTKKSFMNDFKLSESEAEEAVRVLMKKRKFIQ